MPPICVEIALQTHQNQRRIIIWVSGINIDTLRDHFLTGFQIALTTSIAEFPERLAEVQRIVILDSPFFDKLFLIMQAYFQLVFA